MLTIGHTRYINTDYIFGNLIVTQIMFFCTQFLKLF